MRNTTISTSITTTATRRVNGFVGAISAVRSFLYLTFMREPMGYWQEQGHKDCKRDQHAFTVQHLGKTAQLLWLAITAPVSQLAPAAVPTAKLHGRNRLG